MRAMSAICLCLGLAVTEGMPPMAAAQNLPRPDFTKKPLREWLRTLIYLEMSKPGKEAREALDQFCIRAKGAVPQLIQALEDPDERVRSGAAEVLRRCTPWVSNAPARPALLRALKDDPSPYVRAEAVDTLARCFSDDAAVLAEVVRTIRCDPVAAVRVRAVEAFGKVRWQVQGKKVAGPGKPILLEALRDSDPDVRIEAIQALRMAGADEGMLPILFAALRDEDRYVYQEICWSLEWSAKEALAALLKGLEHDDASVRREVLGALSWAIIRQGIPPEATHTIYTAATAALKDKAPSVRAKAAEALGIIGRGTKHVVPLLQEALHDPEPEVRLGALEGLRLLGKEATDAVPAILRASQDPSAAIRSRVVSALYSIQPKTDDMVPVLIRALNDKESTEHWVAVRLLGDLGPRAKAAIPVLEKALKEPKLQSAAAESLTKIDEAAAIRAGVLIIRVDDLGSYLHDATVPKRKGPLRFHSYRWPGTEEYRTRVEAHCWGGLNGMAMDYVLRAKVDRSQITKATIDVKDLHEVEIQYIDDWVIMEDLTEADVETLIQELYEPANKVEWSGGGFIPGGEFLEFTLPMKKLIRLGAKARPAVQKRLGDPAIQNEIALILGAIGDESTVPALIDAYPASDRRRTAVEDHALRSKIVFLTYALTYLTGQPIGRSRAGSDCHPENKRFWQEWWARANSDFRVPAEKYNASWVPHYPDVTPEGAKTHRKIFAEMENRLAD